ncbi:MAG: hypothetical protein WC727_12565, partial [Ignavibacteriaceae bacterium]
SGDKSGKVLRAVAVSGQVPTHTYSSVELSNNSKLWETSRLSSTIATVILLISSNLKMLDQT